jgi:hypothetical protein
MSSKDNRLRIKLLAQAPAARQAAWWGLLWAATFPLVFRQVSVSDAWWHIALGKWLLTRKSWPDLSQFYFTPANETMLASELRWQWLGDILLFSVYAVSGALGLQLLVMACFLAAVFFLRRLWLEADLSPWLILLFVATAVATYQLQLPRNSLFSLALYPAMIWLCLRENGPPRGQEYAAVSGVLTVWSFLHGSCLLGWITAGLILGTRSLQPSPGRLRGAALALLWTAGMFTIISAGRSDAVFLATAPLHKASSIPGLPSTTDSAPGLPIEGSSVGYDSLRKWLNSLIWKREPGIPWSNDYWSPLDLLPGMRPVEAALALCAAAALVLALNRNVPAGLLLAWLCTVPLGLGYVRMFGYTALASVAVMLVSLRACTPARGALATAAGWALVAGWTTFAWFMFFSGGMERFIPEGQHVSRAGKTPLYDSATAAWVLEHFPRDKAFSTIESGSYCLLAWDFRKPVFLDGFFAPHPPEVWSAYHAAARGDLDALVRRFDVTLAVIPHTSTGWFERFLDAPDWTAVAAGQGLAVFAHKTAEGNVTAPGLLARAEDLAASSSFYRYAALRNLFKIIATAAESGPIGAEAWTGQEGFNDLHDLARKSLPRTAAEPPTWPSLSP